MSLADELLADLEESGNDFIDDENIKEEPIDDDIEPTNGHDAIQKMEIDESVSELQNRFNGIDSFIFFISMVFVYFRVFFSWSILMGLDIINSITV